MLAALTTEVKQELVLEQIDIPDLAEDELLIKVSHCGVCGSDLHAFNHAKGYEFIKHPIVLGHEISGTVVKAGSEQLDHFLGKQIIIESMHYCGTCENCKQERYSICFNNRVIGLHFNGGMAEYVKTKETYVRVISGLSHDIAALSEPMAIAVHAVHRLGRQISMDDVVLVQGAGIIGFFVALVSLERGAKVYISGLEKDYASRLSKFERFNLFPHVVEHGLLDEKVDIIFECSGSNEAFHSSFKQLKKGGNVVAVALYERETELFLTDIVRQEWSIIPSYGCNPEDYDEAVAILKKYRTKLKDLITYYPLQMVNEAFEHSLNQKVLKSVLSIDKENE